MSLSAAHLTDTEVLPAGPGRQEEEWRKGEQGGHPVPIRMYVGRTGTHRAFGGLKGQLGGSLEQVMGLRVKLWYPGATGVTGTGTPKGTARVLGKTGESFRVSGVIRESGGSKGSLECYWVQGRDPGMGQRAKGVPGDMEGPVNLGVLAVFGLPLDTWVPLYLQRIPRD